MVPEVGQLVYVRYPRHPQGTWIALIRVTKIDGIFWSGIVHRTWCGWREGVEHSFMASNIIWEIPGEVVIHEDPI